jgi:hypothetical protein
VEAIFNIAGMTTPKGPEDDTPIGPGMDYDPPDAYTASLTNEWRNYAPFPRNAGNFESFDIKAATKKPNIRHPNPGSGCWGKDIDKYDKQDLSGRPSDLHIQQVNQSLSAAQKDVVRARDAKGHYLPPDPATKKRIAQEKMIKEKEREIKAEKRNIKAEEKKEAAEAKKIAVAEKKRAAEERKKVAEEEKRTKAEEEKRTKAEERRKAAEGKKKRRLK